MAFSMYHRVYRSCICTRVNPTIPRVRVVMYHPVSSMYHHVYQAIVHSFRPCAYMFCKQHESAEAVHMLCHAVDLIAEKYYGARFSPTDLVITADKGVGIRSGALQQWPEAGYETCWPHISRKLTTGKLLLKSHASFDAVCEDFPRMNLCAALPKLTPAPVLIQ